jgi:hypothetical protein
MPGWGAGTHPGQAAGLAGQAGWRPQPLRGEAGWTWPHAPCSLHRYASRAYPGHAARRAWPLHHQVYRLPKPVTPAGNCEGLDGACAGGSGVAEGTCEARGAAGARGAAACLTRRPASGGGRTTGRRVRLPSAGRRLRRPAPRRPAACPPTAGLLIAGRLTASPLAAGRPAAGWHPRACRPRACRPRTCRPRTFRLRTFRLRTCRRGPRRT